MKFKTSEWRTLTAMHTYGGSFVQMLADLYRAGDPQNQARLRSTFAEYFEKYDHERWAAANKAERALEAIHQAALESRGGPEIKLFEIRDRATCIPAMAVRVSSQDGPIVRRAGFGDQPCVILTMLAEPHRSNYDPFAWGSARTMNPAHLHILEHWDELPTGSVIDVRVLLGERAEPAAPECV